MPAARPTAGPDALAPLVARMARGDQGALAELYDATAALLHATCVRILRDAAAAEEATLDAFTQAWRSAGSFDPSRASVTGWLVIIARSRALDAVRARARAEERDRAAEPPPPPPGPEELAGTGQRARRVQAALSRLPADQRTVLLAAFFEGLSHSEIAASLGQPLGTVKTRIRTGLMRLRSELADTGLEARA